MMKASQISENIEAALPGSQVQVFDLTGTQDHYRLSIVAPQFTGLMMLKQHRLIYDLLKPDMEDQGGGIHALSLETYSPEQWQQKQGER